MYTGFTTRFRSGGTTWEACIGNLASWVPSQHLLMDTGKPRKTCVEVAGRRTSGPCPLDSSPVTNVIKSHMAHTHNTITLRITTINTITAMQWKITTMHMENYNNAHGKSTAITHNTVQTNLNITKTNLSTKRHYVHNVPYHHKSLLSLSRKLISTSQTLITMCSVAIFRQYTVNYVHTGRRKDLWWNMRGKFEIMSTTVSQKKNISTWLRSYVSLFRQIFFSVIISNCRKLIYRTSSTSEIQRSENFPNTNRKFPIIHSLFWDVTLLKLVVG